MLLPPVRKQTKGVLKREWVVKSAHGETRRLPRQAGTRPSYHEKTLPSPTPLLRATRRAKHLLPFPFKPGWFHWVYPNTLIRQKILRVTIKLLSSVFPIEHRADVISRKADPSGPSLLCRELPSDHLPARSRNIMGLFPRVYQARIGTITHKWLAFCPLLQSPCNAASK